MGLFDIFRKKEDRSEWLTFADVAFGGMTHAGLGVSQETAAQLPAVYRCWSLNAETVASLPVDTFVDRGGERVPYPKPNWLKKPNDFQNWRQFITQSQLSFEADGNIFWLKVSLPGGQLASLNVLNPRSVQPVQRDGYIMYDVVLRDNRTRVFGPTEIVHISGLVPPGSLRGMSPIMMALKESIGIGKAAEQYAAQFFGNGATLSGIISLPATAGKFGDDEAERLKESFVRKHGGVSKSHAVGVLTGGATWTPVTANPEESQLLVTRKFSDVQIAQVYGVPPEYVTDVEGAKGFVSGLYQRQAMWYLTGINPRLIRIEDALTELMPDGYAKFNRNAFLQMDPQDRIGFYAAGLRDRWLTPNEVREKEDMRALDGGDEPLWSVQWQDGVVGGNTPDSDSDGGQQ